MRVKAYVAKEEKASLEKFFLAHGLTNECYDFDCELVGVVVNLSNWSFFFWYWTSSYDHERFAALKPFKTLSIAALKKTVKASGGQK
jgi:hypothetical protein